MAVSQRLFDAIVDGKAVAGVPRVAKLGASPPKDGEIVLFADDAPPVIYVPPDRPRKGDRN